MWLWTSQTNLNERAACGIEFWEHLDSIFGPEILDSSHKCDAVASATTELVHVLAFQLSELHVEHNILQHMYSQVHVQHFSLLIWSISFRPNTIPT